MGETPVVSLEGAWEYALSRPPRGASYGLLKLMLSVFEKPKQMSKRLLFLLSLRALEDHLNCSSIRDSVLKCLLEQQAYAKSPELASLGLPSATALLLEVKVELTLQHLQPGVDDWQSFMQALTVHWDDFSREEVSRDVPRGTAARLGNELRSLKETPILVHQVLKKHPVEFLRQKLMTYIMDCWQVLASTTSHCVISLDKAAKVTKVAEQPPGPHMTPPKARVKTTARTRIEPVTGVESPPLEELNFGGPSNAHKAGADVGPLRQSSGAVEAPLAYPASRVARRRQVEAFPEDEVAGISRAAKKSKFHHSPDLRTSEEEVHDEADVEEVHLVRRRRHGSRAEEEDAVALRNLRQSSRDLRRTGTDPLPEALNTAATIQILVSPQGGRAAATPSQAARQEENHANGRMKARRSDGPILLNRRRKAAAPVQWGEDESEEEAGDVHGEERDGEKDGAGRKEPAVDDAAGQTSEEAGAQHAPEDGPAVAHVGATDDASPGPALPAHAPHPVSPLATDPPAAPAASPVAGGRRARKRWTEEETEALVAAVQKHHNGWAAMKIDPDFSDILQDRSDVDLKDKWRNLRKFGTIK